MEDIKQGLRSTQQVTVPRAVLPDLRPMDDRIALIFRPRSTRMSGNRITNRILRASEMIGAVQHVVMIAFFPDRRPFCHQPRFFPGGFPWQGSFQTELFGAWLKGGQLLVQLRDHDPVSPVPSRAALMTGLYPHQAGMGWMAAADLGTPAYAGNLNNTSVTIAEVLRTAGYSTYMTGKWHLTNERKISGKVIDNWPVQRGFDRYFGIIPGGANYFTPTVYSNNASYEAPENFYLTHAISDTSVAYIHDHFRGGKRNPFFLYVAYTAPHWPLHALQPEIGKYVDRYKQGFADCSQCCRSFDVYT